MYETLTCHRLIISGLPTSVAEATREALILKELTKIVEKLSENYDASVVLNFGKN